MAISLYILLMSSRFIVDTWQYFLHRLMHTNKFLYKKIHSVHHRLYVPYAFGALYNHPFEGFLLDSVGAALAERMSHLSIRQTIFLFAFSTCKTVDDHCGYNLPFDPLQMMSGNNADYHDIHHQVCSFTAICSCTVLTMRTGHRNQIKFLTAFLRPLGYPSRDAHDQRRYSRTQKKGQENIMH